jgi:hypothetical protein
MDENTRDIGVTESVYQAHKKRVLDEVAYRPSDNLMHPQGHYIEQMKEYAETKIPREDAATMRCSSFKEFDFICKYIMRSIGIKKHRVYPALRYIGYNTCYHQMKLNGGDVFIDIANLVKTETLTLNYDVMMRTDIQRRFINANVYNKVYKVTEQIKTIALDQADECEIRTSDLNLYHAMHGFKVLVDNEPEFFMIAENEIVDDVLRVLERTERSLSKYKDDLDRLKG